MIALLSALAQQIGTAAYHLAGSLRFSFGKEALPRYKPCGGVSPAIAQWFDFDFRHFRSGKHDSLPGKWATL